VAWDETKTNMTVSGADLELDEGAIEGSYNTTSQDTGAIQWWRIEVECKVTATPADTGHSWWKIEIDTSNNNIAWNGWELYVWGGEYSCRYYKIKVTVYGEPASDQRPKINLLEDVFYGAESVPCPAKIIQVINQPAGGETRGDRHRVGAAGAGAYTGYEGWLATCTEGDGPSFRFHKPEEGQRVWNTDTNRCDLQDENGNWVIWDPRMVCPFRQTMLAQGYEAVNGIWGYAIDGLQDSNGYITNAAADNDGDYVDYNVGLLIGSYDLRLCTTTGANHGICKIYIDPPAAAGTTLVATFDLFAGAANNVVQTQAAISIATAGTKTVRLKVDGKNGGSGGHELEISWVEIWPN